ncbi:MAG: hypothetical protein E6R08_00340 [Nevskiaceae bacterium]|nr:MAG: hypothetical protein E6R08_00340 [Nevskiaceae bacterium]
MKPSDGFRVDQLLLNKPGAGVACSCGWEGKAGGLRPIGGCSLEAGARVPAGRCPSCSALVALSSPTDDATNRALEAMRRLIEADEALRKGKSVGGDDYEELLRSAKKLCKRATTLAGAGKSDEAGDE